MRRIDSHEDQMNDIVRFEFTDGRYIAVSGHFYRRYGMDGVAEEARRSGVELPTDPVPVYWIDKKVGTLPPNIDPSAAPSRSFFYTPRPGDWTRTERGWEVHKSLGPGDLSAVPGFCWADDPTRAHKDVEDDRRTVLAALARK